MDESSDEEGEKLEISQQIEANISKTPNLQETIDRVKRKIAQDKKTSDNKSAKTLTEPPLLKK